MAQTLTDTEFGAIRVKRVFTTRHVRLRIGADGTLIATLPNRAPLRLVKELVDRSRSELREIMESSKDIHTKIYSDGERIGASHRLSIIYADVEAPRHVLRGQTIEVQMPPEIDSESPKVQEAAKKGVTKALKKEAAAYLPRRLSHLADLHSFSYTSVRYTNAKGRWGSCSTTGTISLNIALMNLPPEIIDYILLHELSHTKEMNHSPHFWATVESLDPDYRDHKRSLKQYTPYL